MKKINVFPTDPTKLEEKFNATRLYLDPQGRYTHVSTGSGTNYASYIVISPLSVPSIGEIKKDGKNQ